MFQSMILQTRLGAVFIKSYLLCILWRDVTTLASLAQNMLPWKPTRRSTVYQCTCILLQFGTVNDSDRQVVAVEEYLVQMSKKSQNCRSLDQLRCHMEAYHYHYAKHPCWDDLSPTSNATKLHIKRASHVTHQMITVLRKTEDNILDPCFYGFEVVGAIVPNVLLTLPLSRKT